MIFNKRDAYTFIAKDEDDLTPGSERNWSLDELKRSWLARNDAESIFISAKQKQNLDELKETLYNKVKEIHVERYPYDKLLF